MNTVQNNLERLTNLKLVCVIVYFFKNRKTKSIIVSMWRSANLFKFKGEVLLLKKIGICSSM